MKRKLSLKKSKAFLNDNMRGETASVSELFKAMGSNAILKISTKCWCEMNRNLKRQFKIEQ